MNPIFISYSRSRIDRATLVDSLLDHGLNPWRDVESQEVGDATTEVIEDQLSTCSAAILWINQDLLTSDYVATVEIPAIARAWKKGGLRIVPVFDGMTATEASDKISSLTGVEIGNMNGHHINGDLSPEDNAAEIARRLMRAHVHDARRRGDPPIVRLVSYDDTAGLREQAVLNFDWRHRFSSGALQRSAEDRLRASMSAAAGALKDAYGSCEVTVAVKAHLPLAVALGHAFNQPTGCTLRLHRHDAEAWMTEPFDLGDHALQRDESALGPVDTRVASVEVSITRDVVAGVNAYVSQGNRYRHRWTFTPERGPGRDTVDGSQMANHWAQQIATALTTLADRHDIDRVDLFLAAPVEVAILVGWWANAVGSVDLMNWDSKAGPYLRIWSLP